MRFKVKCNSVLAKLESICGKNVIEFRSLNAIAPQQHERSLGSVIDLIDFFGGGDGGGQGACWGLHLFGASDNV